MEWLIPVLIVLALVVIVGIYLWATYNSLVQLNGRVDEALTSNSIRVPSRVPSDRQGSAPYPSAPAK